MNKHMLFPSGGVPDRTRTYYLKFRKLALYPDELPGLLTRIRVA